MIKNIILKIFFCLLFSINLPAYADDNKKFVKLALDYKIYSFELAETKEEKQKGLMFKKELDENSGMFFVFDEPAYLNFYMKNTYIPLDIAFIDSDFVIVDIQQMKPLDTKIITSRFKSKYALEVNKGFCDRVGLVVGDTIKIVLNYD